MQPLKLEARQAVSDAMVGNGHRLHSIMITPDRIGFDVDLLPTTQDLLLHTPNLHRWSLDSHFVLQRLSPTPMAHLEEPRVELRVEHPSRALSFYLEALMPLFETYPRPFLAAPVLGWPGRAGGCQN